MSLTNKIRSAVRGLFAPGAAYDERRDLRILIVCILIGAILAVGFGFALYELNVAHRFDR